MHGLSLRGIPRTRSIGSLALLGVMFALFLAFVSANAAAIDGNLSSGDIDVDGLTRHPVTGAIDPNYILGSITYTQ